MKKKKGFWALNIGLLYILPWLVGFLLFKVYPFASSLYYSFTNYDLFNGITKTGLLNYEKIFTDEDIIRAFVVTFKYAIFDVPLKLAFALFIAYILNFKLKGVNFFRTAYYIPSILGGSITGCPTVMKLSLIELRTMKLPSWEGNQVVSLLPAMALYHVVSLWSSDLNE